MVINNPQYTLRLIDLIDTSGFKHFDYFEIYDKVHKWIDDLKPNFYDVKEWDMFIERFCDRYYMRSLNFNTYLDFKIQLRVLLDNVKDNANNLAKLRASDLGILNDYMRVADFSENGKNKQSSDKTSNVENTNNQDVKSKGTSTNSNNTTNSQTSTNVENTTDSGYELYSDTPSDTVNVKDIANSKSNYITNATNDSNTRSMNSSNNVNGSAQNISDTVNESSNSLTNNSNSSSYENQNTDTFFENNKEELIKEVHTSYFDLVNKIKLINSDVINFYLDEIETAQLFSNVLY